VAERSTTRRALFVVIAVVLGLLGVEAGARLLEAVGIGGPTLDDRANYLLGPVFEPDGDLLRTSELAERWMLPSAFPKARGSSRRVFVVGGSFAMGTPYEYQGYGREIGGGWVSWMRAFAGDGLELVNASAGGQSSFRVKQIVRELLKLEPDGLVLASCNNEGVTPPTAFQVFVHRTATFRVLRDLLRDEAAPDDRPPFTPRDRSPDEIARDFRRNLDAMAAATAGAGVPVLMAVPPANLRMEAARGVLDDPPAPGGACEEAIRATPGERAHDLLETCEGIPVMAMGERLLAEGATAAARTAFELEVERGPDNRCPASLRSEILEVAAAHEHIALIDLREAAIAGSSSGVPGADLFFDSCHMNWRGYQVVGRAMAEAAEVLGWVAPPGAVSPVAPVLSAPPTEPVFVENRRWPPDTGPPASTLDLPIRLGTAGLGLDELRAFDGLSALSATALPRTLPPSTFGFVGPWAVVPLLLSEERWEAAPDDLATFELHHRADGVIALAGYVSAKHAEVLGGGP